MNTSANSGSDSASGEGPDPKKVPLPGVAGIALYMLILSAVVAFGVIGHHYHALFLVVSLLFGLASIGLLRQFRWGWALTLAATFLLTAYGSWMFFSQHLGPGGVMAVLNLVFFLYLIRPEVIGRMR